MSTAPPSPVSADLPFEVRGYITDPKHAGYQILTNYESTYWRALVGNEAWGLYEVLRSFCHDGNSTCYPSIRLLTAVLGLKEKRVLTGWTKTMHGKIYYYPGLIELLQQNGLLVAEVQGEGAVMRYVFHVHLTLGMLAEAQLAQIPDILQKKHTELVERCQKERSALEAKRRPPKPVPGGGKLPPGGGNLPRRGGKLPSKQHPINTTHKTSSSARDDYNNNSSATSAQPAVVVACLPPHPEHGNTFPQNHLQEKPQPPLAPSSVPEPPIPLDPPSPATPNQAAEQALLALGIGKTVAQRLVTRYRAERILEKIEFLAFLQAERPDAIENPRGWLRRAIEEDYGAPDGYCSAAERAQQAAEKAAQEEAWRQREQQQQAFADRLAAQQAAFRQQLTEQYGTTEADEQFWQAVLLDFKHGQPDLYNLFSSTQILSVNDERVQLGFTHELSMRRLTHPGTLTALKRALKGIAKRPLEVKTVLLSEATMGDPGEDGNRAAPQE